jgi:Fe2+ or Zn2+ uptake regulation protein
MITWPSSLKKTSARTEVLSAFERSSNPLSVAQLQELCPKIALATLYRVVESFLEADLIELSDEFQPKEKHFALKDSHGHHVVKCVVCHQSIPLKECPIHLEESIEGFKVLHHRLEIEGICMNCQQLEKSPR